MRSYVLANRDPFGLTVGGKQATRLRGTRVQLAALLPVEEQSRHGGVALSLVGK
jgi:hypothetical protein